MSGCLMAGAAVIWLATPAFTLGWTHSVARTAWAESWRITPAGLQLDTAAVKGSGAGMDPGEDAKLVAGWWVWHPPLAPIPRLALAASGATGAGWTLCDTGGACHQIGQTSGPPVILTPCATSGR